MKYEKEELKLEDLMRELFIVKSELWGLKKLIKNLFTNNNYSEKYKKPEKKDNGHNRKNR